MKVNVFQFHGCTKCFGETTLLKEQTKNQITWVANPGEWQAKPSDVAIISGYLLPEDQGTLKKIQSSAKKVIAYGSCTTMGGVFGLANQKGRELLPLRNTIPEVVEIHGCLGEIEELTESLMGDFPNHPKKLCEICKRRSTCKYLDQVVRQIDLVEADKEACFNDLGYMCTGYVASECKEQCINHGTPCRGCKPRVDQAGIRMLGMFGTLMGNIEVATEGSKYGSTDKLADADDDVTKGLPDITGNFFRFTLPVAGLPKGRIPNHKSMIEDVFVGRLVEELPLITGILGGDKAISLTLSAIEAYEKAVGIQVNDEVHSLRNELLQLEKDLQQALKIRDAAKYKSISEQIRKIAGNMNLSNVFYGGFKTPIEGKDNFDDYRARPFEIQAGTYAAGTLKYTLDTAGIITEFTAEGISE